MFRNFRKGRRKSRQCCTLVFWRPTFDWLAQRVYNPIGWAKPMVESFVICRLWYKHSKLKESNFGQMFEGTTIMDFCEFFSYTSYEVVSRSYFSRLTLRSQVFLLLELVSPVLASITIWRLMTRPGAVIRIIIVIHSNIILWSVITAGIHQSAHSD